jgi:hypothetical protein
MLADDRDLAALNVPGDKDRLSELLHNHWPYRYVPDTTSMKPKTLLTTSRENPVTIRTTESGTFLFAT